MPCGKRPTVKLWDKSRNIRVITPSKYEQNEASVKKHWRNVIKELELSYKDEKFWESQAEKVKELVDPIIFERLRKIFDLPKDGGKYSPASEISIMPSEQFYKEKSQENVQDSRPKFSMSDFESSVSICPEDLEEEEWTTSSEEASILQKSRSAIRSHASMRSYSKIKSKSFLKYVFSSKLMARSVSSRSRVSIFKELDSLDVPTTANDDMEVHVDARTTPKLRHRHNDHFKLLYCCESETDMITWKSKYRTKTLEVSASDEFNKKAEIMTKKIAREFYEWWVNLGSEEFKSEIKRPDDIEELFQVWFDEHVSRGIVLDSRTLPCVLKSVAKAVGVPQADCENVLKRQVEYDIHAESSPQHTVAFGTCLPQKMKHIPPANDTDKMWHSVKIPQDLKTYACVWEDILHLTSTKSFQQWLRKRIKLPMPPCLEALDAVGDKKQPFVVPSDFVFRDRSTSVSVQDLQFPVSQFDMELKDVLEKLMKES